MAENIVMIGLLGVCIGLVNLLAVTKFQYIHPRHASPRELARFPRGLFWIVQYHAVLKHGSTALILSSVFFLLSGGDDIVSLRFALYVTLSLGMIIHAVCLVWRTFVNS